jgi:hypothetical protein
MIHDEARVCKSVGASFSDEPGSTSGPCLRTTFSPVFEEADVDHDIRAALQGRPWLNGHYGLLGSLAERCRLLELTATFPLVRGEGRSPRLGEATTRRKGGTDGAAMIDLS